ncbi:MAG: hypothetical protein NTV33_05330 [Coprothermobacterota bacterium]|nr:hypothetical protein [Coprothermobacterota bacterium]
MNDPIAYHQCIFKQMKAEASSKMMEIASPTSPIEKAPGKSV